MDKKILKRIKESKQKYDKHSQRLELLKRNKAFLKEFSGIYKRLGKEFFQLKEMDLDKLYILSEDNILLKLDYPKVNIIEIDIPVEEAYGPYSYQGFYSGRYEPPAYTLKTGEPYDPVSRIEKDVYFKEPDLDTVLVHDEDLNDFRTIIKCKFHVLNSYMKKWREFCKACHIDIGWDGKLSTLSNFPRTTIDINRNYQAPFEDEYLALKEDLELPISIRIGPYTTLKDIGKRWHEIEKYQKERIAHKVQQSETFGRDLCWYDLKVKDGLSYNAIATAWREACADDKELLKMVNSLVSFQDDSFRDLIKKSIKNMDKKIARLGYPLFLKAVDEKWPD